MLFQVTILCCNCDNRLKQYIGQGNATFLVCTSKNLNFKVNYIENYIKMLLIYGCHISKSVLLEFLLFQWKQLRCLSLIHLISNVCWRKLLSCLDTLPQLKHLSLFGVET